MRRIATVLPLMGVLAACGITTSPSVTGQPPPRPLPATAVTAPSSSSKPRSVCGAFEDFYADLTSAPPVGRQIELVRSAQQVQAAAIARVQREPRRVFEDANNLAAYVGRTDFPTEGNVDGRAVQRMVDDCFH
jgi:hypothetical protein